MKLITPILAVIYIIIISFGIFTIINFYQEAEFISEAIINITKDPAPTTTYQLDLSKYINEDNFSPWLGTPLEPAIKNCAEASWYFGVSPHIFLGISFAETTFKNFSEDSYNPYGIMSGRSIKKFNSWHHSCNYFASLIKYNYFEKNLVTPEQLYPVYVNFDNPIWIEAVRTYYQPEVCLASLKC